MEIRQLGFPQADGGAIPARGLLEEVQISQGLTSSLLRAQLIQRPILGNTECINQVWHGPHHEGAFGRWQSIQAPKQNFYLTTTSKSLIIHNIAGRV